MSLWMIIGVVFLSLIGGYVIWRLLTYGTFRSYFQAKLWYNNRKKEEKGI